MLAGIVVAAFGIAVVLLVKARQFRRMEVRAFAPTLSTWQEERAGRAHAWAQEHSFGFLGYYQFQDMTIVAWQHSRKPTFLCQYLILQKGADGSVTEKETFDLVTGLTDGQSLTTCSTSDSQLFPKAPGKYCQSFSESVPQLWQRHLEGEDYVLREGGARPSQITEPLEAIMTRALHEQMNYLRSLVLWPLRGAYWYFVRRRRRHGVSIEEQHRRRWIRLLREVSYSAVQARADSDRETWKPRED